MTTKMFYIPEAAQALNMTEKALRAKVDRRLVPFRRWGGRIVFLRNELEKYLDELPGCRIDEALENDRIRRGDG